MNGVGETWFPLALRDEADAASVAGQNPPRQVALDAARCLAPDTDGLRVQPRRGDAVAFYNFLDNGSGQIDRLSLHAGLPAPGEKSVAAMWYHADLQEPAGLRPLAVGVGARAKMYDQPVDDGAGAAPKATTGGFGGAAKKPKKKKKRVK